jgi:hypothetical protein
VHQHLKSMTVDELFALGIASPDDCDVDPEEVFWQCIEELGKHRASRQIFESSSKAPRIV